MRVDSQHLDKRPLSAEGWMYPRLEGKGAFLRAFKIYSGTQCPFRLDAVGERRTNLRQRADSMGEIEESFITQIREDKCPLFILGIDLASAHPNRPGGHR